MEITDPAVETLLARLRKGQQQALGLELVGSYLFRSVVTGDFESGISGFDRVVVLRETLSDVKRLVEASPVHLA